MSDAGETESQDTHPNAGRDSGYIDEHGNAVGENVINRVTELMLAPQTKMIQLATKLDALAIQQDATVKHQDQRFGYVLSQLTAFFEKEDTRHDAYSAELQSVSNRFMSLYETMQQLLAVSKESTSRLGKIDRAIETLDKRLVTLEHGVAQNSTRITEATDRIQKLEDSATTRAKAPGDGN